MQTRAAIVYEIEWQEKQYEKLKKVRQGIIDYEKGSELVSQARQLKLDEYACQMRNRAACIQILQWVICNERKGD